MGAPARELAPRRKRAQVQQVHPRLRYAYVHPTSHFSRTYRLTRSVLPNRVDLVPFWLPQMDVDIRKPDTGALHIARPSGSRGSGALSQPPSGTSSSPELLTPDGEYPYAEPQSEGEDDDPFTQVAPSREESKLVRVAAAQLAEASSFRERFLLEHVAERQQQQEQQREADPAPAPQHTKPRPRNLSIDPLATATAFDISFRNKLGGRRPSVVAEDEDEPREHGSREREHERRDETLDQDNSTVTEADEQVQLLREWTAPRGTRIAVPVRVEPKVYFASERTFLVRPRRLPPRRPPSTDIVAAMAPVRRAHRLHPDHAAQLLWHEGR